MPATITAVFDSADQVTNAVDDLVSTGIPQEKILINEDKTQIKVTVPDTSEPEIKEILQRHQPSNVSD